jgi:hypothetical protein
VHPEGTPAKLWTPEKATRLTTGMASTTETEATGKTVTIAK